MTQEEKELLSKDIYARLPYNVRVQVIKEHPVILGDGTESSELDEPYNIQLSVDDHDVLIDFFNGDWVIDIKPYLRSMSSMTKVEMQEFFDICTTLSVDKNHFVMEGFIDSNYMLEKFDWLNKHHFDYRGFIQMGLALEAPDGMYN